MKYSKSIKALKTDAITKYATILETDDETYFNENNAEKLHDYSFAGTQLIESNVIIKDLEDCKVDANV